VNHVALTLDLKKGDTNMRYTVYEHRHRYRVRDAETGSFSSWYDSPGDAGALACWLNERARGYA
jgi:hypothetical protein